MNDRLTDQQVKKIQDALDKAIVKGPWEESNFLRLLGKKLRGIRDRFVEQIGSSQQSETEISNLASRMALRSGQIKIYIGIYSSQGDNLSAWERILANLSKHIISRPIYTEERDIQEIIKTKENKLNEAYVVVYIKQSDVLDLPEGKMPVDKLGKHLLSLKNKSINQDNISRFVHQTGSYKFQSGRLVKLAGDEE